METSKETYQVGKYYLTRNRQGKWCRTWYDEQAQQRKSTSLRTGSFEEAKRALDEWFVKNQRPTLEENLELSRCLLEYWEYHAKHLTRADTERRNSVYWLEYFPNKLVNEIRPPLQRQFIEHLRSKGYAKGTIESVFKTGTAAINWAWKNDMLLNPVPLLSPSKELAKYKMAKTERWRALESDEVAQLFEHSDRERLMRFLLILMGTGSRPEAAIQLKGREQINLDAGTLDLLGEGRSQTNKYRPTVRLPSFIRAIYNENNLVSQTKSTPNLNNLRNRDWMRARESAGLDNLVVPYSIRHTMAKWLRQNAVSPWHTSSQLGHKTEGAEITEVYASYDPEYLSDALNAIEEYFKIVRKKSPKLDEFMEISLRSRCD